MPDSIEIHHSISPQKVEALHFITAIASILVLLFFGLASVRSSSILLSAVRIGGQDSYRNVVHQLTKLSGISGEIFLGEGFHGQDSMQLRMASDADHVGIIVEASRRAQVTAPGNAQLVVINSTDVSVILPPLIDDDVAFEGRFICGDAEYALLVVRLHQSGGEASTQRDMALSSILRNDFRIKIEGENISILSQLISAMSHRT